MPWTCSSQLCTEMWRRECQKLLLLFQIWLKCLWTTWLLPRNKGWIKTMRDSEKQKAPGAPSPWLFHPWIMGRQEWIRWIVICETFLHIVYQICTQFSSLHSANTSLGFLAPLIHNTDAKQPFLRGHSGTLYAFNNTCSNINFKKKNISAVLILP